MSYGEILAIDDLLSADECKEAMDIMDSLIKSGYADEINNDYRRKDECLHMHVTALNGFDVAIRLCQRFQNAVLPEYIRRFPVLNYKSLGLWNVRRRGRKLVAGFTIGTTKQARAAPLIEYLLGPSTLMMTLRAAKQSSCIKIREFAQSRNRLCFSYRVSSYASR